MEHKPTKIALISPISRTHYIVPPVGLGYLAAALRKNGFSDVTILDCVKNGFSFEDLRNWFKKNKPDVIGFQIFSYDFHSVKKSVDIARQENSDAAILIGGPHVSAAPADSLREIKNADFGFAGEAEIGLPLLVKKLRGKNAAGFDEIPGLIWRSGTEVRVNPRADIPDLDKLGYPAWDLMDPASYPDNPQGGFYKNFPIAPIATSRGCPYSCTFCGSGVNMGHKLRLRSISHVLDEMVLLYNDFKVREFHIIDDMFNFHKSRVLEFCEGVKKRGLKISFTFPNGLRLNQIDRQTLEAMKDAGLYAFTVGIESGSQRILDLMKKELTLKLIEEKVGLIRSAGLEPNGFFIIGYPGETEEDILQTIRFAKKLKLSRAHFSNFLPLPGTEATGNLIEKGEIGDIDWSELFYSKVPYAPKGIGKGRLKKLQRRAFLEFYLRPSVLFRMLLEIKTFGHLKMTLRRAVDYLFRS